MATYYSGSGSDILTFQYTVQANDAASAGITTASNLVMNGGTIMNGNAYSVTAVTPPLLTTVVLGSGNLYIADTYNYRVRKVNSSGTITTVAGNGGYGSGGDTGLATSANVEATTGIAVDNSGNFYIADIYVRRIREVTLSTGIINTVAGTGTQGYYGDTGPATSAEFSYPYGVAVDSSGNIYIADVSNNRIRKVTVSTGIITTVAGNGTAGYNGDSIAATSAELNNPYGVTVDTYGNLYIGDSSNERIRKVAASTGIITTVAGTGSFGYNGDNIAATSANLATPYGIALDSSGNIYIADQYNGRIRKVTVSTGIITTVAGTGAQGYSGDTGLATSAELNYPTGVAVDNVGNIYIADVNNSRIRKVTASTGIITTFAGNGTQGYNGDNIAATSAEIYQANGVGFGCSR
jgi:sugar lactone lactonase YvrE